MPEPDLLTSSEVAALEQRGVDAILARIRTGALPAVRLPGGIYRVHRADVAGRHRPQVRLDGHPEWLRTGQAAALLRVHADTVRVWANAGALPSVLTEGGGLLRHHRIHRQTVEQLLNTTGEA